MTFKERIEALKGTFQAQINENSTAEEIQSINDKSAELDSLETAYNEVVADNAKFKDTIVRMVTTQGDGKQPKDGSDESKPKTIEECIAEEINKKGEK